MSGLTKVAVESNPLATIPAIMPMSSMVQSDGGDYLPTIKLPYGIENLSIPVLDEAGQSVLAKGQPVMQSATGKMVISNGKGRLVAIPVPYIITAYVIRGATKKTIEEGGKKTYTRTFASSDPKIPSSDKYIAASKDKTVDVGNVALCVVMWGEGVKATAVVGLMDGFKTLSQYWMDPLKNGLLMNKQGLKISIEDHNANATKSRNGFFYYDSRKFNQWQMTTLTPEQMSLACAALANKKATVEAWLKKEE
jgi:hypothetical protein